MPTPKFTLNWYGAGISLRIFVINLLFLTLVGGGVIALMLSVYSNAYEAEKKFLTNALQQLDVSLRYLRSDDPQLNRHLQQWGVLFSDPNLLAELTSGSETIASVAPLAPVRPNTVPTMDWQTNLALRLFHIDPNTILPVPDLTSPAAYRLSLAQHDDDFVLVFARNIMLQDRMVRLRGYIPLEELTHAINWIRQLIAPVFWLFLVISSIQAILLGQMISGPLQRLARRLQYIRLDPKAKLLTPSSVQGNSEISLLYRFIREMLETIRESSQTNKAIIEDFIHEIKNPLASIESAIQSIRKIKDPEKNAMLIKIIEHDLRRMIRILHDVDALFAAGSEGNTYVTNFADVPLVPSLQQIVKHLNQQATTDEKKVQIRYVYDREITIRANQFYFEQMMINLLTNAMSFSPPHGEVVLQTIATADGQHVDIIVDDWGTGIPAGKLAKVFERFYTDRENAPRTGEGMYHSGLGLSIAKQTAASMGGQIWAENRLNSNKNIIGARFNVRLPVVEKK